MNTPSEFNAYLSTVAHCSRDKEGKRILIDSSESVVNFDAVKEDYAKKNSPDQTPASADGLFLDSSGDYVLVEFKAGDQKKHEILKKAYNSAIILSDLKNKNIAWVRNNVKFILVFYPEKASKDENINSRNNLYNQGTKNSSKPILIYLKPVSHFLYDNVYELTPEDFSDQYLQCSNPNSRSNDP